MLGTVRFYNREKGYGFIVDSKDGNNYYCHVSQIPDGELRKGYLVDFQIYYDKKRDTVLAKNVFVVDSRRG